MKRFWRWLLKSEEMNILKEAMELDQDLNDDLEEFLVHKYLILEQ